MQPSKFDAPAGDDWQPHVYPNLWQREKTSGPERLVIAPSGGHIKLLGELSTLLPEPFWLLYVLLVPRGPGEPGRYQCPEPLTRDSLRDFLTTYRAYFEQDGRHHLWVASAQSPGMLIYDNHNVIYAYGPLPDYISVLDSRGFTEGEVRFPVPHRHNYNPAFDATQQAILSDREWIHSPLREQDTP